MAPLKDPQLTPALLAELSAYADGTLALERRAAVETQIATSSRVRDLYERERGVVERLHAARLSDRAPESLRARIAGAQPSRRSRERRRTVYAGAFAGALATLGLALALVLPAGAPGSPSVSQAAALAARGATFSAPGVDATDPRDKLGLRLGELYFPNWSTTLGWRAVGRRSDHLDSRRAVTVFYAWRGKSVAYTIVASPALVQPPGFITRSNGYELRTLELNGRTVVTWRRAGHTCVLSATNVPAWQLRDLAAWRASRQAS